MKSDTPLVSAICPTFGRAPKYIHLLQEAVYWFTRQTYVNRELIIFNDAPNQSIICNVPRVRIINHSTKIKTLGEKYNRMCAEAKGEIIMPWEDDDVSLPFRISQAVEKLSGSESDYFNPGGSWYEEAATPGILRDGGGVCLNSGAFRYGIWWRSGGFPSITGSQDADFDRLLREHGRTVGPIRRDEWSYVYRWGVSNLHISAHSNPNDPTAMQRVYDSAESEPCVVYLDPIKTKDYDLIASRLVGTTQKGCPYCADGKCNGKCVH
jgi:glycosyltransferase involved in cell wall biosynthesis